MTDDQVPRLYLLTPRLVSAEAFLPQLERVLASADVACVMLDIESRDFSEAKKIVRKVAPAVQARDAALLVRDASLAARAGADGVHIAAGEGFENALREAVESLRPERIVGVGGVRTKHEAMLAGEGEADYVMFGDPSPDGWAPPLEAVIERVSWWAEIFSAPCVAYAGHLRDADALVAAGADFIALGAAIWNDPRGPRDAALAATNALKRAGARPA